MEIGLYSTAIAQNAEQIFLEKCSKLLKILLIAKNNVLLLRRKIIVNRKKNNRSLIKQKLTEDRYSFRMFV